MSITICSANKLLKPNILQRSLFENMETYSHLYPNKQTEVAAQLDVITTKDDGYEKTS